MMSVNTEIEWWRPSAPARATVAAPIGPAVAPSTLSVWGFRALVAFAAINITAPQAIFPVLEPLRLALLSAGMALGAYLLEIFHGAAPDTPRPRELTLGLALLLWSALTLPMSLWPGGSFQLLTDQLVKSIIIFWLLARVIRTPDQLHKIFWTLTLVSVPLAYAGISQYQSGALERGRITGYASGLTANPNDLAMMVDLILPLAVTVGLLAKTSWGRVSAFVIVGINLACLAATHSRGGFVGLAVMLLAALSLAVRRKKWALIGLFIVALPIGVALLPSSLTERLATIGSVESDDTGSSQARLTGMLAAMEYMANHPIAGAGLGQDIQAVIETLGTKGKWEHVHNSYLVVGADLGVTGLAIYLAMVIFAYRRVTKVERESLAAGREELSMMASGLKVSFIGLLVTLFFSPGAYNFPIFYLLGLTLALDVAHQSMAPSGSVVVQERA
jgi:O-antigen ligase